MPVKLGGDSKKTRQKPTRNPPEESGIYQLRLNGRKMTDDWRNKHDVEAEDSIIKEARLKISYQGLGYG